MLVVQNSNKTINSVCSGCTADSLVTKTQQGRVKPPCSETRRNQRWTEEVFEKSLKEHVVAVVSGFFLTLRLPPGPAVRGSSRPPSADKQFRFTLDCAQDQRSCRAAPPAAPPAG